MWIYQETNFLVLATSGTNQLTADQSFPQGASNCSLTVFDSHVSAFSIQVCLLEVKHPQSCYIQTAFTVSIPTNLFIPVLPHNTCHLSRFQCLCCTIQVCLPREGLPGSCYIRKSSAASITPIFSLEHISLQPPVLIHTPMASQFRVRFPRYRYITTPFTTSIYSIIFLPVFFPLASHLDSHTSATSNQVHLPWEELPGTYYISTLSDTKITAKIYPQGPPQPSWFSCICILISVAYNKIENS